MEHVLVISVVFYAIWTHGSIQFSIVLTLLLYSILYMYCLLISKMTEKDIALLHTLITNEFYKQRKQSINNSESSDKGVLESNQTKSPKQALWNMDGICMQADRQHCFTEA